MCSNVVLDIPFHGQTGYSHRLVEALGNGKKVITTNPHIKTESFYNSEQVHIMDKQTSVVDYIWVKEKQTFQVPGNIRELELSTWLKSFFNVAVA
jgi:hypothetical protein